MLSKLWSPASRLKPLPSLGDDAPISRKLSLLIRPTMIAEKGKAFVWGDWANIEARLLPWLTKDPQAEERLDIFRAVDRDKTIPDLYTRTAATLSGVSVDQIDEKMRQRGKVTELALGFGGGVSRIDVYGRQLRPAPDRS